MKNTNNTPRNLYSNIMVVAMLMLSLGIINAAGAVEQPAATSATGGSISYTMSNGTDTVKRSLLLEDDSYIYSGDGESDIVIADPEARFHIGIVKKGTLSERELCSLAGIKPTTGIYVLANYLKYTSDKQSMEATSFRSGHASVHTSDTGGCTVFFVFSVKDAQTGKDIHVEGTAVFDSFKMVTKN